MTVYNIMTWHKNTLAWDTRCRIYANRPQRPRRHQHCMYTSSSLAYIAARHSFICRRTSMFVRQQNRHSSICRCTSKLFRQQSRHETAPNTTTIMTDVLSYCFPVIMRPLVVYERLGIYPTVEGCVITEPFHQYFPSLVTPA